MKNAKPKERKIHVALPVRPGGRDHSGICFKTDSQGCARPGTAGESSKYQAGASICLTGTALTRITCRGWLMMLRDAFAGFIETRQVEIIVFSNVSVLDLAKAIMRYPSILKPLVAVCNIAARAIERDLQIKNVDTYNPRLTEQQASAIAGYIKPFFPPYIEIPTLSNLDRVAFIDKEIRKGKGRWERRIIETLNRFSSVKFKKRKFTANGEEFELDAATPHEGPVQTGIDVKRIEARRDIHKRCDEIVNKAAKLKSVFPEAKFAAVIYYPFIDWLDEP